MHSKKSVIYFIFQLRKRLTALTNQYKQNALKVKPIQFNIVILRMFIIVFQLCVPRCTRNCVGTIQPDTVGMVITALLFTTTLTNPILAASVTKGY